MRFFPVFLMAAMAGGFACGAADKISYDSVPMTEPFVAITFDDGPSPMLTPQVLKILAAKNIKATFFAVGESAQAHPEIIRQEIEAGHEVGSRAWSDSGFSKTSDAAWHSDMARTDQALKLAIGRSPRLFCPADTTFTDQEADQLNKDFGYRVILWNVDSLAAKSRGAAAIVNTVVAQVKPGSIIMSSDIDSTSVQALPAVIDALASKGYRFVTVSQLIALGTPAGMKKYLADNPDAAPKANESGAGMETPSGNRPSSATTAGTQTGSQGSSEGFHPFGVTTPPPGTPEPNNRGTEGQ